MTDISDEFIDVFFPDAEQFTFGDLGASTFAQRVCYEDIVPIIPRNQWEQIAEENAASGANGAKLVTRIYDQGQEGSCVANACSQAHEIVQAKQFGEDKVVHLSAISLYKRIGRSPNSGAMVDDGLDEIASRGVLPLDTPENRARFGDKVMSNTGFHKSYPDGWQDTAKLFRGTEWSIIRTFEGMGTALLNQHPVVVGRQGHSICYVELVFKSGRMLAPYPNSWSTGWGQSYGDMPGGFGFDSESQIKMSANWAFALRSVVVTA